MGHYNNARQSMAADRTGRKFVVADHGRYEEYTVSILDVSALSAPSVNKHQGTQCIIRKEKVSYQLRKRAPLNEADAKRRETSIKHGAMRAGRRVSYYICSMPYCLETFLHVLQALRKLQTINCPKTTDIYQTFDPL